MSRESDKSERKTHRHRPREAGFEPPERRAASGKGSRYEPTFRPQVGQTVTKKTQVRPKNAPSPAREKSKRTRQAGTGWRLSSSYSRTRRERERENERETRPSRFGSVRYDHSFFRRRRVRLKRTNLRVKGLSLNRSQKWTALLSTTPRLRPRSSTNDLAPLHRTWLLSHSARGRVVSASAKSRCAVASPPRRPKSVAPRILSPADVEALTVSSRLSGRDSDLEAFSHNPSDGSFAPLAYQPST